MQYYKYGQRSPLQPCYEPFNTYRGRNCLITKRLIPFILISFLFVSCGDKPVVFTAAKRKATDSIVGVVRTPDSLAILQKQLESEGNLLGSIVALRERGKLLRNESRFEEALHAHSEGLRQAEAIGDTLEWVQALNNIGTDYRRMGVLDVAQEYHYSAWELSKECADTSFTAKKNRVVSLNGLGNIYLTIGNYNRADSVLRMALKGEQELHSAVGQAINYANLGSIFEHRRQTDSAWVYYRKSMALNTEANNDLGKSLCHTYFGSLYQQAGQYDKAREEYEEAYRIMSKSKDEWHALNILIALAGIYHATNDEAKEMEILGKAKSVAEAIESPEHLAEIHTLYYKYYKEKGDCRSALASYEHATAMQDSVLDMGKVNRIQNTGLSIERNRQTRQMNEAQLRLERERTMRYITFVSLGGVLLVLAGVLVVVLYTNRLRRRNHLALKKLSALRENFFTNITHEFRTPLTVILGLSHDLQEPEVTDVGDKAQTIERQGNGLLMLINQLLDISKIKSSVGNADWRNGNITAYFTMIVESWRDYARSKNIDLQFFAKNVVEMDFVPDYVSKVINNLLSNAFKFTPEYGKVSLFLHREEDWLCIDVEDTGKGMDKKTLAHMFEAFYQAESDVQNIGTGVGLALVKQIMDAVEGKITAESTLGKGTTFHIRVPIRNEIRHKIIENKMTNTPLLPQSDPMLADSEGSDDQCRLLVIEDNSDIAAYIGAQFDGRYAVSYATNGTEGLTKAQEQVPDLIITDLMMPGMDGLEVCRQVRSNEIINHIPIIIVTAKITEEERIKGIAAGADAYLSKPFNADELRTRVEKLLDNRRLLHKKYAQVAMDCREEDEEDDAPLNDAELRFLSKVSNNIQMLLSRDKGVDVSTIASSVFMSNCQFYRKLVALTGYTPSAYIQRIKIQKAKSLLDGNPQMSFNEVADRCGFDAYPNFVRAFKNVCGVTPTEYRRKDIGKV